ncbi:MAG TPA: methylmalonyl-CoA epimerase [Thermoplasmata archaeon]|jgi:methylmalonyl-CoA epimerase|nr:methylmalonyl-CoA epimerase [Thermoplasmata archaeon]
MKLDHVGIAVANLADAVERWRPLLGAPDGPAEEVPGGGVRVAFLSAGGVHVELVEPTGPTSPISKFLASRGDGIHHLAYAVPDVDAALGEVARRGGRLLDERGRPGARGRRVGFCHPSAFGGVLVEFVEERR